MSLSSLFPMMLARKASTALQPEDFAVEDIALTRINNDYVPNSEVQRCKFRKIAPNLAILNVNMINVTVSEAMTAFVPFASFSGYKAGMDVLQSVPDDDGGATVCINIKSGGNQILLYCPDTAKGTNSSLRVRAQIPVILVKA